MSAQKCKHEPRPYGNILNELAGDVECALCGRLGRYSRGQRKFGRPRKVLWRLEEYSQPNVTVRAIENFARSALSEPRGEQP